MTTNIDELAEALDIPTELIQERLATVALRRKLAEEALTRSVASPEQTSSGVPIKRLTLEIPVSLHRKIKLSSLTNRTTIKNEVMTLLLARYASESQLGENTALGGGVSKV
jgi:hypothetical protein